MDDITLLSIAFLFIEICSIVITVCVCKYDENRRALKRIDVCSKANEKFHEHLHTKLHELYRQELKDTDNVIDVITLLSVSTTSYKLGEIGFCETKKIDQVYHEAEEQLVNSLKSFKKIHCEKSDKDEE